MNPIPDELYDLILSSLYGIADETQESRLAQILEKDTAARKVYVDFLMLYTHLHRRKGACLFLEDAGDSLLNENAWQILAEQEKTAEAVPVERPAAEPQPEPAAKVAVQTRVSKLSIYSLVLSSAALIFLIAYAHLSPITKTFLIGKLTRTVQAQWQDASGQISQGCDLYAGPMNLVKGYAEITFDTGATVVIQAPSRFTLESAQQMYLQEGRVVASMKGGAKQAFVVRSPTACVVDYGTEFGVTVNADGRTETFVYEGQVQIRDSSDPVKFMKSMLLKAGQGAVADADSKLVPKTVNPNEFVRSKELDIRYQAQKGGNYYRWRAWVYQVHRDPSLAAHYFLERQKDDPLRLINEAFPTAESTQGMFGDINRTPPSWTQGRWPQKQAVRFERGKNQAIVIPPDPSLAINSPLTLSTWISFPNAERWGGHLISCRENKRINYQFSLFDKHYQFDYQRNRFEFRQYDESGGAGLYSRPFLPESGKWYHFAVVYDGSEVRFYVNGLLLETLSHKGLSRVAPAEIILGSMKLEDYVFPDGDFDGVVDELMIFKRCLSESEILDLYENGKP